MPQGPSTEGGGAAVLGLGGVGGRFARARVVVGSGGRARAASRAGAE
ncbi:MULTISPECIES: hypothetical protein [unclassified Streptomyces]|nr:MULTISPECIES: hypothetical protein [unclassified Streptomyces]